MKSRIFKSIATTMILAVVFTIGSFAGETAKKNIVQIASADARFSTLVEAVIKADLAGALSAEGPYTVFAPTNDAFTALFNSLGVQGIEDLTAEQLKPILLYHVLNGQVMSSDVTTGKVATLNQDASLMIEVSDQGVMINSGSRVIITDVQGTNGVIHAIDKVLVPTAKTAGTAKSGGCN